MVLSLDHHHRPFKSQMKQLKRSKQIKNINTHAENKNEEKRQNIASLPVFLYKASFLCLSPLMIVMWLGDTASVQWCLVFRYGIHSTIRYTKLQTK